jgi:biotin transporter BioY
MVCVGAPFSASAKSDAMWYKGAIVGSSGGYFVGFILASYMMGVAAERGAGRPGSPRSLARLVLWMFAAEGALYALALFYMPFGMAIAKGVSPSAICPESGGIRQCIDNVFAWGFTPFVPGDLFKMALVTITVPFAWGVIMKYHQWRTGDEGVTLASAPVSERDEIESAAAVGIVATDKIEDKDSLTQAPLPGAVVVKTDETVTVHM